MLIALLFQFSCFGQDKAIEPPAPVADPPVHQQVLMLRSADWQSSQGQLQRFQWSEKTGWAQIGTAVDVALGKDGMAWIEG